MKQPLFVRSYAARIDLILCSEEFCKTLFLLSLVH